MKHVKRFIIVLTVLIVIIGGGIYGAMRLYPMNYGEYVEKYCDEYGVSTDLAYAVIKCESGFNPDAVSDVGAIGLMQLTPETFEWIQGKMKVEVEDTEALYDPETNIRAGIYLLSINLADFETTEYALSAYHAGRGVTEKWVTDGVEPEDIPYSDTKSYIKRVVSTQKIYDLLYN